jgi:hypothetical protein
MLLILVEKNEFRIHDNGFSYLWNKHYEDTKALPAIGKWFISRFYIYI